MKYENDSRDVAEARAVLAAILDDLRALDERADEVAARLFEAAELIEEESVEHEMACEVSGWRQWLFGAAKIHLDACIIDHDFAKELHERDQCPACQAQEREHGN